MTKSIITDNKVYTDDELKGIMLKDLFSNSSFRVTFKDDMGTCMRCWDIVRSDKEFYKEYTEILNMKLTGMEEDLLTGKVFEKIPTKVDQLGNEDLAPGYLKLAEIQSKRLQWIMEKRNEKYTGKELNSIVGDGAKILVMIPKREDDSSEEIG